MHNIVSTYQTNNVMKKIMLYLTAAGFMFASCQKDDEMSTSSAPGSKVSTTTSVGPVPGTFTQKVLIEKLTGQNEPAAPANERYFSGYAINSPSNKYYVASLYNSGYIGHAYTNRLIQVLGSGTPSMPTALVNRKAVNGSVYVRPYAMTQPINNAANVTAACGLAMTSSVTSRTATINIHTGFNSLLTSNYRVNVYIIEDQVMSYDPKYSQANAYNNVPGSPFYNLGNPILNYQHSNVVRGVVSGNGGDPISSANTVPGGTQVFTYRADLPIPSNNSSKFYVMAFITDNLTKEVMNVQMGELGSTVDWN